MAQPHPSNRITLENVEDVFRYHPPTPAAVVKHEAITQAAIAFARVILEQAPDSADRSAALRWVQLARMSANSAIALDPPTGDAYPVTPAAAG